MRSTKTTARRAPAARAAAAGIAATIAFTLAACAPSEGSGESEAAPREVAVAISNSPNSLDPARLDFAAGASYIWFSLYDTLLFANEKGELEPNAAESWEYSDDALSLTLQLRDDLSFADGSAVTASDVAGTMQRTMGTPGPRQPDFASVETIEATGEHELTVRFTRPDPSFIESLGMGAGVIADPDTLDDPESATAPLASGPYVIDEASTDPGSTYVLRLREDYWNAEAYDFETLTVRVIPDSTATFNALMANELDVAGVSMQLAPQAEEAGFTLTTVDGAATFSLNMGDRDGQVQPALADPDVRRAINHAIDRAGLVQGVYSGQGQPTEQFYNINSPAWDEALEGTYEYDPELARELLAEAGYADGFTVKMPSHFLTTMVEPTLTQLLAEVGITIEWVPVPPQDVDSSILSQEYPMWITVQGTDPLPNYTFQALGPDGKHNPFHSTTPELATLIDDAFSATDAATSNEAYRAIGAYAHDEAWFAPFYSASVTWATSPGIAYLDEASNAPSHVRMLGLAD